MEAIFDIYVTNLLTRLDQCCADGEVVDLRDIFSRYQYDLMGGLAIGTSFNSQSDRLLEVPEWNHHFFLSCIYGMVPSMTQILKRISEHIPFRWFRDLAKSRAQMRELTSGWVKRSIEKDDAKNNKSLLDYVIEAQDPETGAKISDVDVCTEAFGFLYVNHDWHFALADSKQCRRIPHDSEHNQSSLCSSSHQP